MHVQLQLRAWLPQPAQASAPCAISLLSVTPTIIYSVKYKTKYDDIDLSTHIACKLRFYHGGSTVLVHTTHAP